MGNFGYHLKKLRESRGMTVNQLAMYSQISSASISRYESGDRKAPKPENIRKLSTALKIPYEELLRIAGHLDDVDDKLQYAEMSELDLSDDEIVAKYNVTVDGVGLKENELRDILTYVRITRTLKKSP